MPSPYRTVVLSLLSLIALLFLFLLAFHNADWRRPLFHLSSDRPPTPHDAPNVAEQALKQTEGENGIADTSSSLAKTIVMARLSSEDTSWVEELSE